MSEIPREPSHYQHTVHSKQQRRDRGIDNQTIADVIESGDVWKANKPHQREFVKWVGELPQPIGVVVDPRDGSIITVEWVKLKRYYDKR